MTHTPAGALWEDTRTPIGSNGKQRERTQGGQFNRVWVWGYTGEPENSEVKTGLGFWEWGSFQLEPVHTCGFSKFTGLTFSYGFWKTARERH